MGCKLQSYFPTLNSVRVCVAYEANDIYINNAHSRVSVCFNILFLLAILSAISCDTVVVFIELLRSYL